MASITKTEAGTWRVQVECAGVRRSKTVRSEEAARQWATNTETRLRAKKEMETAAAHTMLATLVPKRMLKAMAEVPHTLKEVLDAAFPAESLVGVYFLIRDGEVIYVGQSIDVLGRISKHRREGRDFDAYTYLLCSREDLDRLESTYITAFMPWLNVSLGRVPTQ